MVEIKVEEYVLEKAMMLRLIDLFEKYKFSQEDFTKYAEEIHEAVCDDWLDGCVFDIKMVDDLVLNNKHLVQVDEEKL